MAEITAELFDHHFLLPEDRLYREGHQLLFMLHRNNDPGVPAAGTGPEDPADGYDRDDLVAYDNRGGDPLDADPLVVLRLQDLLDVERGNDIVAAGYFDDGTIDRRQVDRNLEHEGAALPRPVGNIDFASQLGDLRLDDIHPHPPSRDAVNLFLGRKAGQINELQDLFLGILPGRVDQFLLHCLFIYFFNGKPLSVVVDLNIYVSPPVAGRQDDMSRGRLSRCSSRGRILDAVGNGVADQVHQRIVELVHNIPVDLRFLPGNIDGDFLAEIRGRVAADPVNLLEGLLQRHHAQRHGNILDFFRDPLHPYDVVQDLASILAQKHGDFLLVEGLGDQKLPEVIHQIVYLAGRYPDI